MESVSSSHVKRHCQLPDIVAGVFMRVLEPSPRMSCMGMIAVVATDASACLMKSQ